MDDDEQLCDDVRMWKCKKHPLWRRHGVCPNCLRDRLLLLLCPECAHARPCGCLQSSSSAFSSPFSFISSSFDPPRSSVGAVGRVGTLIDDEPALLRSRSAAFRFLRPRLDEERRGGRGWAAFWPFSKDAAQCEEGVAVPEKLLKSRTVSTASYSGTGCGNRGNSKVRRWHWFFPSPFNAFRHRKSAKVVQERSPFRRGRSVKATDGK